MSNLHRIKKIKKYLKRITKPTEVSFWGTKSIITPAMVNKIFGDGLQIIYFEPLDTRPNYYIVRIDSKTDIETDFYCDDILNAIADQFDERNNYEGEYFDDVYKVRYRYAEEDEPWQDEDIIRFPMLDYSCGFQWGVMRDFSNKKNWAKKN
jgi:hypothetical protein